MSALTILYCGEERTPSWVSYEENEVSLGEGNYFIPLFWLAMFKKSNIEKYEDEDDEILVPYFCGSKDECLSNFKERKEFLSLFLPNSESLFKKWTNYIEAQQQNIISIDFSEVYFMDDEVDMDISNILNGFERPNVEMIESFVALCGSQYDPENRDLILENGRTLEYHLVGYKSNGGQSPPYSR